MALAADAGGARGLGRSAAAALLGMLLAGVQLVPSWAYLQRTTRVGTMNPMEHLQWPFEPWRMLEWIVPGFFGGSLHRPDPAPFVLLGGPTFFEGPFTESVFIGAAVLVAAAAARGRARPTRILLAAAAIALWLSLGHRLGGLEASSLLPVWSRFRYPEKLMAPFGLCAAALCALGTDRIAAEGAPRWLVRASLGALGMAAIVGVLAWSSPDHIERFFTWVGNTAESQPMVIIPADAAAKARAHLAAGVVHAIVALASATALLWFSRLRRARWIGAAFAALVFLESSAATPFAARSLVPLAPEQLVLPAFRATEPVVRIVVPVPEREDVPRSLGNRDATLVRSRLGVSARNVAARVDNMVPYGGLEPKRWANLDAALAGGRWRGYRRFAVTHVVIAPPATPEDVELSTRATEQGASVASDPLLGASVWAVPHRPWASFATAAVSLPTPYDVHDKLLAAIAADDQTVFVESREPVAVGPGTIWRVERRPERIRIEAEAPGNALLVVNDAFMPGWRASIDRRETEIFPADILVRAVRWPAGRHVLEMVYDPPEVSWGLVVSASGCVLVVLAGWAAARLRHARAGR